ncbi:RES domain-containing protein [Candidatus Poriferisodalis sp.]|uniref:RES domain-containing protein n=1 Tax=Candidatus Poriferisodalis sp. TaxID=3101277 RepID=UPI003B01FDC0
MRALTTSIGGTYYRVADPDWSDPLDPSFASAGLGRRWNPPGLACLYLNADVTTARANVWRLFVGLPYGPEDLEPATAPVLVNVAVPDGEAADAFSDDGLVRLGLPTSFPHDGEGELVPHRTCQPLGQAAFDAGLDGVDARSAAAGGVRELVWFPRGRPAQQLSRLSLDQWW